MPLICAIVSTVAGSKYYTCRVGAGAVASLCVVWHVDLPFISITFIYVDDSNMLAGT